MLENKASCPYVVLNTSLHFRDGTIMLRTGFSCLISDFSAFCIPEVV